MTRQQDTLDARAAADEWATARGLPPSGGYSGGWYRDGYLGGWWPDRWPQWWAAYGISAGRIIGGDIVAHQYGSTPVDLDAILESEIVTMTTPAPSPHPCAGLISGLAYVADTVGDQILAECQRKAIRKATLRAIVAEMQRVRTEQVGPRP